MKKEMRTFEVFGTHHSQIIQAVSIDEALKKFHKENKGLRVMAVQDSEFKNVNQYNNGG